MGEIVYDFSSLDEIRREQRNHTERTQPRPMGEAVGELAVGSVADAYNAYIEIMIKGGTVSEARDKFDSFGTGAPFPASFGARELLKKVGIRV